MIAALRTITTRAPLSVTMERLAARQREVEAAAVALRAAEEQDARDLINAFLEAARDCEAAAVAIADLRSVPPLVRAQARDFANAAAASVHRLLDWDAALRSRSDNGRP